MCRNDKAKNQTMPFLSGSKHLQQEDMQWMPGQPERKGGIEKKQEQFKNSNWAASVKNNRNASRVVNSAQLSVSLKVLI